MWMSLARRSSALKMVVSTRRITGAMSLSAAVSRSMERVSSALSSSATTSSAKPSVTSSSTRCDCSVFLSRSEICESVATLTLQLLLQQDGQLVDQVEVAGVGEGDLQGAVFGAQGHEVVAEHQVHRDGAEQLVVDVPLPQVDELAAVAPGQLLGLGGLLRVIVQLGSIGCHIRADTPPLPIVSHRA